ncbi:hypothetical protein [Chromobacterium fluminis]|uniref:hypothetical protein n=1 Tax=Chromobacterium fluminis TaxID=3044269 RepID=UPI00197FC1EF|nr:hypothetical protein [Chromobacterium haemolyticum]
MDAIARSKRILALVDDYHERPTADTRTALRIALMDEFESHPSQVGDLVMLIKQLVRSLCKAAPDNEMAARALDYLKRKDLLGSPLR